MRLESDRSRLSRKLLANIPGLALMFLGLALAYVLINHSDNQILEQKSRYRLTRAPSPFHLFEFGKDE